MHFELVPSFSAPASILQQSAAAVPFSCGQHAASDYSSTKQELVRYA